MDGELRKTVRKTEQKVITPSGGSTLEKPKAPSAMSGKALGVFFVEALKLKAIDDAIYNKFTALFEKWGETKGPEQIENLRDLRQFYKTII